MRTIWGVCVAIGISGLVRLRNKRKWGPGAGTFDSPLILPFSRIAPDEAFQFLAIRPFQQKRLVKFQITSGRSELSAFRNSVRDRVQRFAEIQQLGAGSISRAAR